ncbi:unnamed protein product [Brassica rapa subsp. trilocularis]
MYVNVKLVVETASRISSIRLSVTNECICIRVFVMLGDKFLIIFGE